MSEALRQFWTERSARERVVIALASILVAVALAYAYAWLPVTRERDRMLVRVPELRAEAQSIERDARESEKFKSGATKSIGLSAAVQQASAASNLPVSALEIVQLDPSKARVTIASARADQVFRWVARVQSVAGVRIENLRLTSLMDGDRVTVQAVLLAAP